MKNLIVFIVLFFFFLNGFSQINSAEYFIDGVDPGTGNATALSITANHTITENFTIPTTGLAVGLHTLHVRVKDDNNEWSLYKRAYFYVQNSTGNTATPQNIVAAEYFIDTDSGVSNSIALTLTQSLDVTENFTIPTAGLANGLHVLHIRVKDANANWSLYKRAYFYVHPSNNSVNGAPIVAAEYFFDTDPGVGSANAIDVTQGMTINENFTILLPTGLTDGNHYLFIRVQDQDGNWSLYKRALLTVDNSLAIANFISDNIKIYPNPVKDILHINLIKLADYSFAIYDLNGREIRQKQNLALQNSIDLSILSNGVYFIKLIDRSQQTTTLKFVKN